MTTLSQFKSKYVIEKREPLRGDSLNKNIVKRVVTDPLKNIEKNQRNIDKKIQSDLNIPDDGGKAGQSRIEKELELNSKNKKLSDKEISRRRSAETTRGDAINRSLNTSGSTEGAGGANTGTTKPNVDDSVKSVRTNRRTINKVTQPNVVQGSGSGITANKGGGATTSTNKNIVNKPSTEYRQLQNKARGILKDLSKEKTASQNVVRPKLNYDLIGNKLDGKTGNQIFQQNKITNTTSGKTKIELPKFSQQSVNKAGGSSQTFIKPKNFSQFRTGSATLNKVKPPKEKNEDLINFFMSLQEDDDVQNVYSNVEFNN